MNIMIGNMMPMTIRVTNVKTMNTMVMPGGHAAVHVHVPGLNARAVIRMAFESPAGSSRDDWAEIAYEKALMMLDPA